MDGVHAFSVRATDAAANTDATPDSRSWIVDTTAPGAEGVAPQDGATGVPLADSIVVTFSEDIDSSTINGSTTFTLTKQGASEPLAAQVSYDSATRKATLHPDAELESGITYTATLKGGATGVKDLAGNPLGTDKTWSFSTLAVPLALSDTTPPETTIDGGPAEGSTNADGNASFSFSSSETGSSFQCAVDGGAYSACSSPKSLSGLANGQHSFAVKATDAAGNTDQSPATRNFSVDIPLARYNVTDYGATPNDSTDDTVAFQNAMKAAVQGGGVAYVPSGTFLLSGMKPPDHATLQIEATATIKKAGTLSGPIFVLQGPDLNTFSRDVHIEGVNGDFTVDTYDSGPDVAAFRVRNVQGFSIKHMTCIQNNTNQTAGAPSSAKPCISFLPLQSAPLASGLYAAPYDGVLEDLHSIHSPYGWGLTQFTGGQRIQIKNISGEGGVPLRLENFANNWTPQDQITADGVTCENGHSAVMTNPHGATQGTITVTNVVANSCESALSIHTDATAGGSYNATSSISGVTITPGNTAQDRDSDPNTPVGGWVIGPSRWCVDSQSNLGYTIQLSGLNCGGLPNR
jgi:hypothetical protein